MIFRVYNPCKPIKYGIKSYICADSVSSYCWNLRVYDGEGQTIKETVLDLLDGLLGKNHQLFCDNFYNSVGLSEYLLANGMHSTGTLRANRGEPQEIREAGKAPRPKMKKGEIVSADNGSVTVIAWQDNRKVTVLTTAHDDSTETVSIRKRGGGFDDVDKPVAIVEYNKYMSGKILSLLRFWIIFSW